MNRKNLLSIGEISKYTGAGIKALRYYDKINVLKPAYVDPDTERRYYSFNQVYQVGLIMFCVELDVPLKELSKFIDGQDTIDFQAFLVHGKEMADKKKKALEKGLRFIDFVQQKIALHEEYPFGRIYTRDVPVKNLYVIPYERTFEKVDQHELTDLLQDAPYAEYEDYVQMEYGFLCEYSPYGIRRYVFIELPHDKVGPDCKTIPAGKYHCRQSDAGQIEQAADIFKEYLAGKDSFIAIEMEIFTGTIDANRPINELRVIGS